MKKFLIHTMGCKSNQFEGQLIKQNLEADGFVEVNDFEDADIYILNSCTVTHKSDNEALYLLRSAKHKNPKIINVLTGCFAQIEKDNLLEYDFIDYVVGNDDKLELARILQSGAKCCVSDIMQMNTFHEVSLTDSSKTRASLKIQDGCDNRCSYCIIPFARGKSRSADEDFVISQIKNFEAKGFKEIVFTGIHIGLWGKEFGKNLLDLLKRVEAETEIARYRLGSLYPDEISDELLQFLAKSEKFCHHFHLSLQSACNKTLKAMNRHYTVEFYLDQIDRINDMFNLPFIGSDIIAGFAGESEEDFEITRENLEKSGLTQIHTFPYSIRSGTVGATLDCQVDDDEKNRRADIIKDISRRKYENFVQKNIGTVQEVLIEKRPDKHSGLLKGVTRNYLTVNLDISNPEYKNTLANVLITKSCDGKLFGELSK